MTLLTNEIAKLKAFGQIGALGETSMGIILNGEALLSEPQIYNIQQVSKVISGEADRTLKLHVNQFKLIIESLKSLTEDQITFIESIDKNELNQDQIFGVNLILGDLANIERTSEKLAIGVLSELL